MWYFLPATQPCGTDYLMEVEELSHELYSIYNNLMQFAVSRTHDVTRAEDLVSEVILAMLRRANDIPTGSVEAYAIRSIKNRHIDDWRRETRERENLAFQAINVSQETDPLTRIRLEETLRVIEGLGVLCKQVLKLHFLYEYTYAEMANALNINPITAGTRMTRCRNKLDLKLVEMGVV